MCPRKRFFLTARTDRSPPPCPNALWQSATWPWLNLQAPRYLLDLVSSAETLPAISRAKARGLDVNASVSINHLALNEIDIGDYNSFAKFDPPLRGEDDRTALLSAVNDGTIDVVVSAHDPQSAGEKRRPFAG